MVDMVRTDTVMVEAELEDSNYPLTEYNSIWFVKASEFLRFESDSLKFGSHGCGKT